MAEKVVVLPGDGTGPEVMAEGLRVLQAVARARNLSFDLQEIPCGGQYYLEHGRDWPEGSERACSEADLILLGAVGWPDPEGSGPVTMSNGHMAGWSPVIGNRTRLDLYANIRPVKLYPNVSHRIHGRRMQVWDAEKVDMVFLRENTEGLYSGVRGTLAPGGRAHVAVDTRLITRRGSERIIRTAFELARKRERGAPADGKKRLTCIVKDNVLDGCRLFRDIFFEIGKEYPDIVQETAIVDAFTQWLVTQPEYYNVCVTTNMFGDILTDLASVLQGGMGMAVGANVGDRHGMFEPIHGSAPRHAGKDKVNPMAMILTVAAGLEWLGGRRDGETGAKMIEGGKAIEASVMELLAAGSPLTYDLAGEEKAAPCSEVGKAIASLVEARLA